MINRALLLLTLAALLVPFAVHHIDARTRLRPLDDRSQTPPARSLSSGHSGRAPWYPDHFRETSERIILDAGPGLDTGCIFAGPGDTDKEIVIPFTIGRAIGDRQKLVN